MIKRASKCYKSPSANSAISRLKTYNATKDAGCLIDPPVSEPIAAAQNPAATEAALPPELPPGTLLISQGFEVTPKTEVSVELPLQIHLNLFFLSLNLENLSLEI